MQLFPILGLVYSAYTTVTNNDEILVTFIYSVFAFLST